MKRTGDPTKDRIEVTISGKHRPDIHIRASDVDGLTSYYIPLDLGALGRHDIVLDLLHPDEDTEPEQRQPTAIDLGLTYREKGDTRHAIAGLVGRVAMGREQPTTEVLDAIIAAVISASGWLPPERLRPPPPPIPITRDPEPPSLVQRLREWSKGR